MAALKRLQLDFIDGLRAVAALYIVVHHSLQASNYFPRGLSFMGRGHDVVAIFIAISGFCLALPLARQGDWILQAGRFYRRRIRRILPPYFAAVAIGIFIALAYSYKSSPQDYAGTPLTWTMVVSHLLLVQNWIPGQQFTLDGPLWSIAVECQIYLLFPLLVLLWRKGGKWLTLSLTFVLAHGILYVTHHGGDANFLFLFVEGMLGAELAFSAKHKRWVGPATLLSFAAYLGCLAVSRTPYPITDIFIGLSSALTMAFLTQYHDHWGNALLGWKPLAWIGTFSYSIYLVHSFLQMAVRRWISTSNAAHLANSPGQMAAVMVFLVAPLAVAVSYGFHIIFERPFLSPARQRVEQRLLTET